MGMNPRLCSTTRKQASLFWILAASAFFLGSCAPLPEPYRLRLSGVWIAEMGTEPDPRIDQGLPVFPPRLDFHASIAREGEGPLMLDFYDGRSYVVVKVRRSGQDEYRLGLSRKRAAEGLASPRRTILRLRFIDEARAELSEERRAELLLGREEPLLIRKLLGPGLP